MWIHYGLKSPVINRDALGWMLSTQFDCLNRKDPFYKDLVMKNYDSYCRDRSIVSGPDEKIFNEKLVNISEAQKEKSRSLVSSVSRSRKSGS